MTDTTTFHNNERRTGRDGRPSDGLVVTEGPAGYEVYRSPEFRALCKLIGVDWAARTKEIEIRLTVDRTLVVQTVQDDPAREAPAAGLTARIKSAGGLVDGSEYPDRPTVVQETDQ